MRLFTRNMALKTAGQMFSPRKGDFTLPANRTSSRDNDIEKPAALGQRELYRARKHS